MIYTSEQISRKSAGKAQINERLTMALQGLYCMFRNDEKSLYGTAYTPPRGTVGLYISPTDSSIELSESVFIFLEFLEFGIWNFESGD